MKKRYPRTLDDQHDGHSEAEHSEQKEIKGTEEKASSHQHEHGGAPELADLDRSVDELWERKCEHNILHYTCDECRYELGVVKLSPTLLAGQGSPGIGSTTTAETKNFSRMVSLTGEVSTNESKTVRVSSPESGIARSSIADIGQKVTPGAFLSKLTARKSRSKGRFFETTRHS